MTIIKSFFLRFSGRIIHPVCASFVLAFSLVACNEEEPDLVHEAQINQWQYIDGTHGLASDYINTVFEDSKGNFWIGTDRGLSVIRDNMITTYTGADGLLDNNVYAVCEDKNGDIWVGTRRGVNIMVDDQWLYFNYFFNVPVFDLLNLTNEQGMLIATGGYGTFRFNYETSGFQLFERVEDCEGCNRINSLFQAKDESIWVASFRGARRIRGNFVTRFDRNDGLAGNIATNITEDSWGNIWVGTVEGKTLSKINGNSVSQVVFNNGADQNFIFCIQEDNDGKMWVGTVENGLFHFDGAIMKQVYEGPPDTTITTLFKDSRGNLWVGTSDAGLAVYIINPIP